MNDIRNRNVRTVFGGVGIALLLCALMVMMSWSQTVTNAEITSDAATETKSGDDNEISGLTDGQATDRATFDAEAYGYDEDDELLGMRTTHSKAFVDEDGGIDLVYSSNPLHYTDVNGKLVNIDYSIVNTPDGYAVASSPMPVEFGSGLHHGLMIDIGMDNEIHTGSMPAFITMQENPQALTIPGGINGFADKETAPTYTVEPIYFQTTDAVSVGGNSISYPVSDLMDVVYTVSDNKVKQDFVINQLSEQLKATLTASQDVSYVGLGEFMEIPIGHHVEVDGTTLSNVNMFETQSSIRIVETLSGVVVATIDAPVAYDGYNNLKNEMSTTEATYFVSVDQTGTYIEILTVVSKDWILSDEVNFPITIDPTITVNTVTTPGGSIGGNGIPSGTTGGYSVCNVDTVDCTTRTDGYFRYDGYAPSPWGGSTPVGPEAEYFPIFDFDFANSASTMNIEKVTASMDVSYAGWTGVSSIVIMEDCGGNEPDGDKWNLYSFANPSGCTGNALPAPSGGGGGATNILYVYSPASSTTSTGSNAMNSGNGIFSSGTYKYEWKDSYGDGPNNGQLYFETRAAGSSGSWSVINTPSRSWGGYSAGISFITVPAGDEMRMRYACLGWNCYLSETTIEIIAAVVGPSLPALTGNSAACAPNCAPTGSESPTASYQIPAGKEIQIEWTCGNIGCATNEVFYRVAGSSGWNTHWDICATCTAGATYESHDDNIVFNSGTYEFLVWDRTGGGTTGGSGMIGVDDAGTWGSAPVSDAGARLVSSISTTPVGDFSVASNGDYQTYTEDLCLSVTQCNAAGSPLLMLANALSTGGYIEFGLGFGHAPNAGLGQSPYSDGLWRVAGFKLIIDLESNIPDTTPPADMTAAHYDGVNSYIEGPRTFTLSVEDSEYAIDTSNANGPKLWYSVDGSPYISVPATLDSSVCAAKEQTCDFSASTQHIASGSTVDYYWEYRDTASPTSAKPTQSPNTGRSPATGAYQFTVLDPVNAPTDGTAMKLTALVENVKAGYDSGSKTSTANTIDRQLTYYPTSGEYLFEFDTSSCATETGATTSCFSNSATDRFGHWAIQWQDSGSATSTNACAPDTNSCSAPDNVLELDSRDDGPFDVSRQTGLGGDMLFWYDSASGEWISMVIDSTPDINNKLTSAAPDAVSVPNVASAGAVSTSRLISSWGGSVNSGDYSNTVSLVVPAGKEARLVFHVRSWDQETGFNVNDGTNDYQWGRTNSQPFWGATGSTISCASTSGFAESSGAVVYSNSVNNYNNCLPGGGVLPAGTYSVTMLDSYGDGSNGGYLDVQIQDIGGSWGEDPNRFDFSQSGSTWTSHGFAIDLADPATPSLGTNANFAGNPLGANDMNLICVTTNGLVYFMDTSTIACKPDAEASSLHNTAWQGFAMSATVQGEQPAADGMLWSIRNVAPDPDVISPDIDHNAMGDSHAFDRTVRAVISDPGYEPSGLDVSPIAGVGPTMMYEVYTTGSTPTGTYTSVVMTPEGDRTLCADMDCVWTADLPSLTRDQSVNYKITAQDTSIAGINTVDTGVNTFDVANPTNTLVIEWQEYADLSSSSSPCSFQVVMYDVSNEFEFHYDDQCSVSDMVGLVGHRKDTSDYQMIRNVENAAGSQPGNPHSNNIRVTNGADGYSYEHFDLGITSPLPLASSTRAIAPSASASFNTDNECVSSYWSNYQNNCAGNFDLPDDFDFDFWGTTFSGSDSNDRVHVSASGMMYFIEDGSTSRNIHQGTSWANNGNMYDIDSSSPYYPDYMISPWWSRENNDFCGVANGCGGVWYRTIPYDGQGKTVSADIVTDTTWYLVDSPIKVNPSSSNGYLSIDADLTIEPGVDIIVSEGKGISFDGGLQADGTCAQLTALGSGNDRITFNADRTTNTNALWHGLAFTDECNGGENGRHNFDMVDISNTQYAAITAGSRPAHPASQGGPSCGTQGNDCDVGEFLMNDMTFTNVDSAFAHGSGQGTVVTMSNFAVTDARSACFNFAENTVATLTGTVSSPSTMTRCNTVTGNSANTNWGGAVVNMPGSTAGSLTMSYVDIEDSFASLIRTDFQIVNIDNVHATMSSNGGDQFPDTSSAWSTENSGVNLGLSHALGSQVVISDFSAPNYHHGWIYAADQISLTNVDLGTGIGSGDYFHVKPFGSGSSVGTTGSNSVFSNFDVGTLELHATYPSTFDDVTTGGSLSFFNMGTLVDVVSITNSDIGGHLVLNDCGNNVDIMATSMEGLSSLCNFGGVNDIVMTDGSIDHSTFDSAMYIKRTNMEMYNTDISSSTVDGVNHWYAYVDQGSTLYVVESTYTSGGTTSDCADNANGKTGNCPIFVGTGIGTFAADAYYGGYANAIAYRLVGGNPLAQSGVTITASTLDPATSVELFTIGSALTDSNGATDKVVVITGNHAGDVYDSHHVRASGAAGDGEAHPVLGSVPATLQEFVNGVQQTPPVAFTTYNIDSQVDIRILPPPVTLDDPYMDCAWMATNQTFISRWDGFAYTFTGAETSLTLDGPMVIDSCDVVLNGARFFFKGSSNSPSLTITGTGSLTLDIDPAVATDVAKIEGKSNADAVDIRIQSGGLLDMQAGTIKNLLQSTSKTGLLVVESGGVLQMGGGASIAGSDTSSFGAEYPIIHLDGGKLQVNTGTIASTQNTGTGVFAQSGEVVSTGLTVLNANVGVKADSGALALNGYTSTDNNFGVLATGALSLPSYYRSAVLEGITTPGPGAPGMGSCIYGWWNACWEWNTYTVDFSSYIGQTDYFQPSIQMNYEGGYDHPFINGLWNYLTFDNFEVIMEDDAGNTWSVDSSSEIGYYPYGANDPAVGTTVGSQTLSYDGGAGGSASWDCNYRGRSYSPFSSFGQLGPRLYSGSSSMGGYFGQSGYGYPAEFGFRISKGTLGSSLSDVTPLFDWGQRAYPTYFWGSYPGMNANHPQDSPTPYDVCWAAANPNGLTTLGANIVMEFPIIDLRDPTIEKVHVRFDMEHDYDGFYAGYARNNIADNAQLMSRGSNTPTAMGDYQILIPGKGINIDGATITGATHGIYLDGDTVATISNTDIVDPLSFGLIMDGANDLIVDGLTVTDSSAGANSNYGLYAPSTSSGTQEITNSEFTGLGTGVYLNNDVSTEITDTTISNGPTGLKIGGQSDAAYFMADLTISNVDNGIVADGNGLLDVKNADITSNTNDVVMTGSSSINFLDGTVDQSKVAITGTGLFERARSYIANLEADGNPVSGANVVLSSRDAASTSYGVTQTNGESQGLQFSVWSMDSVGLNDFSAFLTTYKLTTVAMVDYSWTDENTNSGDFRYLTTNPTLSDAAYDPVSSTNYDVHAMVDTVDIRVCSSSNSNIVVAPCAGTLAATGNREYSNGMFEYGDDESLFDSSGTVDLSNKVVMVDTGTFELRDGMTYNLDGATILHTGYDALTNIGEWYVEEPYGTTLSMTNGDINGIFPEGSAGQPVGMSLGGTYEDTDSPLGIDFDNVDINGLASIVAYNGNWATGSWSGYSDYEVPTFKLKNSYINHYRGYLPFGQNVVYVNDMCLRIGGGSGGEISGNTFSDCTVGVFFEESDWNVQDTSDPDDRYTSQVHDAVGADMYVIDNNIFRGATGGQAFNVWLYTGADADQITVSNNDMTCNACFSHVAVYDDTSVMPEIFGNSFTNGEYGVYTSNTEHVMVDNNQFNNIEISAVWANGGDVDMTGNTITNSGGALLADSLEKPEETVSSIAAGINTGNPVGPSFANFNSGYQSVDIYFTMDSGDEMQMTFTCGSWCYESSVNYKQPNGFWQNWNPSNAGSSVFPTYFTTPGLYFFNMDDSYGDGANGGRLEVEVGTVGTFSSAGIQPTLNWNPTGHSNGNTYYSNTNGGLIVQNTGSTDATYEFVMLDSYGDGANGNSMEIHYAPIGTWTTSAQGPTGLYLGGINDGIGPAFTSSTNGGDYSDMISVTLPANSEMRFTFDCVRWCSESSLDYTENTFDPSWNGPDISNNVISNPGALPGTAYGLRLENCDMNSYSVQTVANTINLADSAVLTSGCTWLDQGSTLTGTDAAGSIGFDDDNAFASSVVLDGTTVSGFETGILKTSGDLFLKGGSSMTAGSNGYGVLADGIVVRAIDAAVDGGTSGTGMHVSNSPDVWVYPMDASGNVGLHVVDSELRWEGGAVDAGTVLIAEGTSGHVHSLTDPAGSGGPGLASSSTTTQVDVRSGSSLEVVDWSLDENKVLVDGTSIIEESNWLDIDANHLGAEPAKEVGVSIISDNNYAPYTSSTFDNLMVIDGGNNDWVGGNALNPSGYAMPGSVGGPMWVTATTSELVMAFDGVSTSNRDVYVYFNTNDMIGTSTGFNGIHTLPFGAEHVLIITGSGASMYANGLTGWTAVPSGAISTAEDVLLEVSVPLSALGTGVETIDMVATVQSLGIDDITDVSPAQSGTVAAAGPATLTDSFRMDIGKLDLADGTMEDEVLLYRAFRFSSTPTAPHTYTVMVKTEAAPSNCAYDWATSEPTVLDEAKSLTFEILRACPEIQPTLDDITVFEDTGAYVLDLASFVDDEQDDEELMEWSVTSSNLNAYNNILTDWADLTSATGDPTITPIIDQFGTFELTFEVVDTHGQTDSHTITYTVVNINDTPVICDAQASVDPDCSTGEIQLYADANAGLVNVRNEGFTSYTKGLGDIANDTGNSFIRDMANEQSPVAQTYTWVAGSDCDQFAGVQVVVNADGNQELVIVENTNWEEGGTCDITLALKDNGQEFCYDSATGTVDTTIGKEDCTGEWLGENDAESVIVPFSVAPVNDAPVIAVAGNVVSSDGSNSFIGEQDGNYRVTLTEDTPDGDALKFDFANIKSDIDHLDGQLTWDIRDTNSCTSSNYFSYVGFTGDELEFRLHDDATTNAEPWEVDMLNNNGIHQTRTANGYCEMYVTLSDTPAEPSHMMNYTAITPNNYEQQTVEMVLSVKVDNVAENVPDYYFDANEGFDFNGVNYIMPGTYVPVDFNIYAGGDEGPYTYNHQLVVNVLTDGHEEPQLSRTFTPPAYGEKLFIDDWEVFMTRETTNVWVEMDVVTLLADGSVQLDDPESHHLVQSGQVFGKWSSPGAIGEDASGTNSNRRPAFEDKNWCNNLMSSTKAADVPWDSALQCGHSDQGYNGAFVEDWQKSGQALPVVVTTIGALSVPSFAPSIVAVALTGLFVSALVLAGRREEDEEEMMEELNDDESAVSPVIATILMVAITVVLSGVVYVWAAQLADTDTKGVPVVTFSATNEAGNGVDSAHWKIVVGTAGTPLATQAVEVTVAYFDASGTQVQETINLASTDQVYGFSPFNSDSLVTFSDVVDIDGDETISSFGSGDEIFVKTHLVDGTPLEDVRITINYAPPIGQGALLKAYSGLNWNQPVF